MMKREIIEIEDYTLLIEESSSESTLIESCLFDEPIIGIAFYGAGDVSLRVRFGEQVKDFRHTKGMVLSFYADDQVEFEHHVSKIKPLQCLVIATKISNLDNLPKSEAQFLENFLRHLLYPIAHFVEGPRFNMNLEMSQLVEHFFNNNCEGEVKMRLYKSQITALFIHYFGHLSRNQSVQLNPVQQEKIQLAKEILLSDIENPPSLTELAHQVGINTNKLKREFKAQFGVPVFKYLQNERLQKAYTLIKSEQKTIQEAAWAVGYDSVGSFSNAFKKKFGYRPSQV